MREGRGNCVKYLKRGGTEEKGEEREKFLKRGTRWVKGWVPQKEGRGWNPVTNFVKQMTAKPVTILTESSILDFNRVLNTPISSVGEVGHIC